MKKHIFLLLAGFTFSHVQSQEITDALQYSQHNLNGTARFSAMSGAFGALGGDLSAINVNPAGSAVFSNNQVAVTLTNFGTKNNSNYYGTNTSDSEKSFGLNQAGGVFVFKNQNSSLGWKKFSVGINYENTNNFDNSIFTAGTNPTNSLANYFVSHANGIPLYVLQDSYYGELDNGGQQAFLGYQAYVINPVTEDSNNTNYTSNATPGGNYHQENRIYTNGYNGKLSFNLAASYENKLFLGANLNSHFSNYVRQTSFYESNNNPLGVDDSVTNMRFDNNLHTTGTGFSFQLGAIAKVTDAIRLGLSYDSPIWYKLSDELSQSLVAVSANTTGALPPDIADPEVINYYDPYKLSTPGKLTGSFAYVFGKKGLISLDYSIKDYANTKFEPEYDTYYTTLNNEIRNSFQMSNELRIGGEYKIKALSLRAGYRFEESPYTNNQIVGDLKGYSGGLGYNFGIWKIDLAYAHAKRSSQQTFFNQGFTDSARINTKNNNVSVTASFEL